MTGLEQILSVMFFSCLFLMAYHSDRIGLR